MRTIVISFIGSTKSPLRLADVEAITNPETGRADYGLTSAQAQAVLNAWEFAFPRRALSAPEGVAWTWVIPSALGIPERWEPLSTHGSPERWSLASFPGAMQQVTVRRSDRRAVEALHGFMNAPGGVNGGDLVEFVTELLQSTGREINA